MGLQITPNSTTRTLNYPILSAREFVSGGQSMLEPQVNGELFRNYGLDNISGWIETKGMSEPVMGIEYFHGYKEAIREIIKVDAASAGSANAAVTLTVASGYRQSTSNTQSPYVSTGTTTSIPVRQQDLIQFPDGTRALVTAVSGNTFTSYPIVSGDNIPAVTTSTEIIVYSNAVAEGASSVSSRTTLLGGYRNNVQRFRNTEKVTDTAMQVVDWFDNLGESGTSKYYFNEAIMDAYTNHVNDVEMGLITGKRLTNTTLANVSGQETTITTEGMIPFIDSNGNVETYTAGSFSLTEIDNMGSNFSKYRGAKEYEVWHDYALGVEIDNLLRTSSGLTDGGVVYSTSTKDRYVDFGFSSFTYGGFTYHKKLMPLFNLPEYFGASGHIYTGMGILVPQSNVITAAYLGSASVSVPSCQIRYVVDDKLTNGHRQWDHGGRASTPTSGENALYVEFESVKGMEFMRAGAWGLFKRS